MREIPEFPDKNCKAIIILNKSASKSNYQHTWNKGKNSLSKEIGNIKKNQMGHLRSEKYNWDLKNTLDGLKSRMERTKELVNMKDRRIYPIWTTERKHTEKKLMNRASGTWWTLRKHLTFTSLEIQKVGKKKIWLKDIQRNNIWKLPQFGSVNSFPLYDK